MFLSFLQYRVHGFTADSCCRLLVQPLKGASLPKCEQIQTKVVVVIVVKAHSKHRLHGNIILPVDMFTSGVFLEFHHSYFQYSFPQVTKFQVKV